MVLLNYHMFNLCVSLSFLFCHIFWLKKYLSKIAVNEVQLQFRKSKYNCLVRKKNQSILLISLNILVIVLYILFPAFYVYLFPFEFPNPVIFNVIGSFFYKYSFIWLIISTYQLDNLVRTKNFHEDRSNNNLSLKIFFLGLFFLSFGALNLYPNLLTAATCLFIFSSILLSFISKKTSFKN